MSLKAPTTEHRRRGRGRTWLGAAPRLSQFAVEHLLLLPLGALIAMVWVNTEPESYYRFTGRIAFAVNDVGMVLFFALMTKEVVEATVNGGVLHPWRRALVPVIAAIGATILPAVILGPLVYMLGEPVLVLGWPAVLATDLAVSYFAARIIFRQHPVVPFLLLLALASDAIGFAVLAVLGANGDLHLGVGALILIVAVSLAAGLRRARVMSFWPYLLGAGGLSWYALFWCGIHPALALVPIMPFLPHVRRDPGFFVDARPGARDTLSRFEVWWRYPGQVALFLFGLVNAGVSFRALELGTLGVPIAVIVGKPVGILIAAGAALAAGLHLPQRVGWRELVVMGFLAAVGFSVGLFFCTALLPPGQLQAETSMGVMLTLAGAPLAVVAAKLLGVGRFGR